jgi:succinate-semialdehyde dehydrogenase/glutarate-semialdehyde dehydrogenase
MLAQAAGMDLTSIVAYPDVNLFINGEWRPSRSGERLPVVNPVDGSELGSIAKADREDMDEAVAAAAQGFEHWRRFSAFDRYKLMRSAAENLRKRSEGIAQLMTREQGKPLAEARVEIANAADIIDWFAEEGRRANGWITPSRIAGVQQMSVREPVGPVAAFTPWNFPINQIVRKLAAALAAGCSIIVKAPEETPASPAELVRVFLEAGLPPGTLGLLYGDPSEISEYLIPHPLIRKISFTGSTAVGKQLAALAGAHMKRITMELGGHAPAIVFADTDIKNAAELLARTKYRNAGQVCISPTRFLVQRSAYVEFVDCFVAASREVRIGDGLDPNTQMGPLANPRRVAAIQAMVADAAHRGAEVHNGGQGLPTQGNFVAPTVLTKVTNDMRVQREEPFGPLSTIAPFDDLQDAAKEANRLPFGLASYAFTRSSQTALALASAVETGMMTINHIGLGLPEVPFGGVKDSGYGTEGGPEAINAYLNTKFVSLLPL